MQEALDRLMQGRTSVVIAHRLSTIRNAHEILVINEGQITERGTHDQLLNFGGTYSELVRLQDLGGSEFLQSKNSIAKS